MVHDLKCWPQFFGSVANGSKTFEVRRNDRPFSIGDYLRLREWSTAEGYTGFEAVVAVTYILGGAMFGVEPGYVVMAIRPATKKERAELGKEQK